MLGKVLVVYNLASLNGVLLRYKLPLVMVLLAVLAAAGVGVSAYSTVNDQLSKSVTEHLVTTSGSDASAISRRWGQLEAEVHVQASSAFAALAIEELSKWIEIGEGDRRQILAHFQGDLKRSVEERVAETGKNYRHGYSWRHVPVHETYASVLTKFDYADIYLVSQKGRVVYSTTKGVEFGQMIDGDTLKGTALSAAFTAAMKNEIGQIVVIDFEAFAPAGGEKRAFLAQPIFESAEFASANTARKVVGTLIVAVTPRVIDDVISQSKANGSKARSFIVGHDATLRSSHILGEPEFIPANIKNAISMAGSNHAASMIGATGVDMIGTAQTLPIIKGAPWTMLTVESRKTAFGLVAMVRNAMIMASAIVILPLVFIAIWVGWSIAKPISRLARALQSIAAGRVDEVIPARERRDEIGAIADAVHLIRRNMAASSLERESEQQEQSLIATTQRKAILLELASELDHSVGTIATAVSAAAEELNATARELDNGASETRSSAKAMSSATARVVQNMQGIDKSAVALRNAVDEIDREVNRADGVAEQASRKASSTQEIVLKLDEGAKRVSDVVVLISKIAEQTNLLALNATIEAARAGDAGRGFAVVASEVKLLASQTAKATEEISHQINLMNDATQNSVAAIGDIQQAIAELSAVTRRTAQSVSEQKQASRAIVDDVNTVSDEIEDISTGTSQVGAASGQTFQSAQAVLSAASELTQQACELHMRVENFIARVRAA